MIVRAHHRVLVQGITGKQGTFWTERMREYGTNVVAGVNPKRAGQNHCGVPVFATAKEAMEEVGVDVSVMFIPPAAAQQAAIDAVEAGVKVLIILTEHIPAHDVMRIHAAAKMGGTRVYGPNTAGLVTPGECFVGIMPAFNERVFTPGSVGVISRSGSLGTLICLNIVDSGLGQSAFLGIGGDPMIGTTSRDALEIFDKDDRTDRVAIVGEIGGALEEEAAEYAATMKKPVVAFIAGSASPPGKKMGHAGAIVLGNKGSYASKRKALEEAGVIVVDTPGAVAQALLREAPEGRASGALGV